MRSENAGCPQLENTARKAIICQAAVKRLLLLVARSEMELVLRGRPTMGRKELTSHHPLRQLRSLKKPDVWSQTVRSFLASIYLRRMALITV